MKHELNKTTKHTENISMGFDGLIGLFEHTQVTMQTHALRAVNSALVVRNWLFGWYIVEFEHGGADRAEMYGRQLIKQLSIKLTANLGKGFSQRSLEQFRRFYMNYQKIAQTLSAQSSDMLKDVVRYLIDTPSSDKKIRQTTSDQSFLEKSQTLSRKFDLSQIAQTLSAQLPLSWSHYLFLMGISKIDERLFYEIESANEKLVAA